MKRAYIALFLAVGPMACADDLTLGANRSSGMAGAGLALRRWGGGSSPRNPAVLAWQQKFRLNNLDFGYRTKGMNLSELNDRLKGADSGGLDPDELASIAREFGDRETEFGLNGRIGLGVSGFNFGLDGSALATTLPNEQLKTWVGSGGDLNNPVPGMRLDGYGYGFYQFNFGYGGPVTVRDGEEMGVGAQVRLVKSYYSHHFADQNQIVGGGSTRAIEMGADDVLTENGVAVDIGWSMATGPGKNLELALVINNLAEPKVAFDGTSPTGGAREFMPFKRSVSLGTGYTFGRGIVAAMDAVELGSGHAEFRAGVDVPLGRAFGLAAGYGSRGGWTGAVSLFGVTLTIGPTNGFRAGTFFRF